MAVVLVEAGPEHGLQVEGGALGDAVPGLGVAPQRAGQHGVEGQPFAAQVFAEPHALAPPERAQLVIVVRAKRGLAMAHKVEGSHGARW
jgi:hypothetical protein